MWKGSQDVPLLVLVPQNKKTSLGEDGVTTHSVAGLWNRTT